MQAAMALFSRFAGRWEQIGVNGSQCPTQSGVRSTQRCFCDALTADKKECTEERDENHGEQNQNCPKRDPRHLDFLKAFVDLELPIGDGEVWLSHSGDRTPILIGMQ